MLKKIQHSVQVNFFSYINLVFRTDKIVKKKFQNHGAAKSAAFDFEIGKSHFKIFVLDIINSSYDKAMQLLTENRDILDHISEYLYEKETITGKEFMKIFREMKGLPQEDDKKPEDTAVQSGSNPEGSAEDGIL